MTLLGDLTRAALADATAQLAHLHPDAPRLEAPVGTMGSMKIKRGQSLQTVASGKMSTSSDSSIGGSPVKAPSSTSSSGRISTASFVQRRDILKELAASQSPPQQRKAAEPVGRRSVAPLPVSFSRPERILGELAGPAAPATPPRGASMRIVSPGSDWSSHETVGQGRGGAASTQTEIPSTEWQQGNEETRDWHSAGRDAATQCRRLKRAAVSGSPAAMARLGGCLLRGEGMPADPAAGVEWLRRAARQDDPAALSALGAVWEAGAPPACGMPPDMHKAVKYYRRAAELGNADGTVGLAQAYLRGDGVRKDAVEARRWLSAAARQGHPRGALLLGKLLIGGGEGVPAAPAEAAEHFRAAAASTRDGEAHLYLARCYVEGRGVPVDSKQAEKHFVEGAALGNMAAAAEGGALLLTTGSVKRGADLLKAAVGAGVPEAFYSYGRALELGRLGMPDRRTALALFYSGAKLGDQPCAAAAQRMEQALAPGSASRGASLDDVSPSLKHLVGVGSGGEAHAAGPAPSLSTVSRISSRRPSNEHCGGLQTVPEDLQAAGAPSPRSLRAVLQAQRPGGRGNSLRRSSSAGAGETAAEQLRAPAPGAAVFRRCASDISDPKPTGTPSWSRRSSFTELADGPFAPELRVSRRWSRTAPAPLVIPSSGSFSVGSTSPPAAGNSNRGRSSSMGGMTSPRGMSNGLMRRHSLLSSFSTQGASKGWNRLRSVVSPAPKRAEHRRDAEEAIARLTSNSQARMKSELEQMRTLARDSAVLSRTLEEVVQRFWLRILALEGQLRAAGHDPEPPAPDMLLEEVAGVPAAELASVAEFPEGISRHASNLFLFDPNANRVAEEEREEPSPFDE